MLSVWINVVRAVAVMVYIVVALIAAAVLGVFYFISKAWDLSTVVVRMLWDGEEDHEWR